MDISSDKVLDKIEELVTKAKHTESREKLGGYATAIQALCDLLLEERIGIENDPTAGYTSDRQLPVVSQAAQPISVSMPTSKPVKMDDANGDSLFDF
ncbi:YwdI family protein [Bacillus sp. CECT 9360]|uniref:YwdI family protein n=1 Tax=Bacillus sp. CECT 9360 TaxID=2845821 RepID=UPI001E36EAFA|nr:YwdI family protein [Bacillus sp. CECT 9360]CAH0345022.1 hypothetical protein BCI9360_01298 [Bacillus sp. CECT 9360]